MTLFEPKEEPVKSRLNKIVWNERQITEKPDIKLSDKDFLMDTMPFNSLLKERLTDAYPLQYQCEGKYISFKPVGGAAVSGVLGVDKQAVTYKDGLGSGIDIEVQVSQSHWRKIIHINSLASLGDISKQKFVEFKFEVDSDFGIGECVNEKPRIKLGEDSYIEVAQVWDSRPLEYTEEELAEFEKLDIEIPEIKNSVKVDSFFKYEGEKLYFTKRISVEWLLKAIFPIWTDTDITWGDTPVDFGGATVTVDYIECCEIDSDKFVVAFRDVDDGYAGKARVGTVSGTTITWGAISEFCGDVLPRHSLGLCKLDTDKFVVVYPDDALGDDGFARAATVDDDPDPLTIHWGTAKEIETSDMEQPSACQLGTDKFATAYNDEGNSNKVTTSVCTVSGTTISTPGIVVIDDNGGEYSRTACCKLDTDKYAIVYIADADGDKLKAVVCTVSGTTPSPGDIVTLDANDCTVVVGNNSCGQLDTDKFAVSWLDYTDALGETCVCTVSGTTITPGDEQTFNAAAAAYYTALAVIDSTHYVIIYYDAGNSGTGTSVYCTVSGTDVSSGDEEVFHDAKTYFNAICLISANKIVACYRDYSDVNYIGEAIVGDIAGVSGWTTIAKVNGVGQADIKAYPTSATLKAAIGKIVGVAV